ncbi:MAG: UDP-N-acetylmuramate dehydrogenase [Candidatus Binatia bacterium]|nr:UDP-N-acetylmuramate dehydrogenase [Candidatus Binatia bacterium]
MEHWGDNRPSTPVLQHSNLRVLLTMTTPTYDSPLARELKEIPGLRVKLAEPLARYASMKIGGPADYFIEVESGAALAQLLPLLKRHRTPICFLGNGSNVLISDRGVRGAVIRLAGDFKRAEWKEEGEVVWLEVGAACALTQLVREAARKGYAGLEFAEGIPGTVGGAQVMNAGAYGSEFEKIVDGVEGIDSDGRAIRYSRKDMTFTYRDSHWPAGAVVTRVRMRLRKEEAAQVSSRVNALVAKRKSSQPSGYPNSGSMFRNPPGDFAGRLIEAAALKGKRIGQAQISERHANFIVNLGGAKAEDVHRLMELVRAEVKKQFAVELVAEVRRLGEWDVE